MYIRVVFAIIFRKRYNYIAEAKKMPCEACKWPFWANVRNFDLVAGGVLGGVPVLAEQAQATKNLEFF